MTALAAGPLQPLDAALQGYWAKKYTPNWANFLDSVPNAVAGQAVCLPVLLIAAVIIAWRRRTWHPLAIVAATEAAFYGGIGGMKVLLGRTAPAAGEGVFWQGGAIEHGWYGIAYPSGHAAEAVLMYGAAAYLLRTYASPDMRIRKRLNWLVALITLNAIVVAFYLGYHWPTDLLGGMIAGGLMLRIIVNVDRHLADGRAILGFRLPSARRAAPAPSASPAPAPAPSPAPAPAPTPVPVPAAAPPALARTVTMSPVPRPEHLPGLRPVRTAHSALDLPPARTTAAPFLLRERPALLRERPAHGRRQLQTSAKN